MATTDIVFADRELDEIRSTVRALTEEWHRRGLFQPRSDSWVRSFDLEFSKELAARGLIGMTWPARYGGGERSNVARLAATEELLRAGAPVAAHWIADRQIGPSILRHGSDRLKDEILPGITRAENLFCLGMSEPGAGSDLAAVRTVAHRVEGGWRLTGRKIWTSGAHKATHAYVLARTEKAERKHDGLSEFVVDMSESGTEVTPIVDMAGEHHFNEVAFDDVFIPEHRLIGVEGQGWRQVVEQLSFERGGAERVLSTYPVLSAMIDACSHADEPAVLTQLGTLLARLGTLRRLCWDVAHSLDQGKAPVQEAATLKLLGNEFERDVVSVAREVLSGHDSRPDSIFGQALLASPGFSIRGGAADVLLSIIAKQEARA
ncbi:acyl-CoA dehydrogenase family protein [Rhodococcus opacus]|uniref:acyl-CoA dehydrogenase family protein n=1 Tax=Rhodococcus opacus TaxID=37919 RepID=UPI00247411BC|nr:acyl-CoA dehydrogenase family protein [Rhodococcus opacus]MDH6291272.1 acyl-CoA dehydrogenase [Rhodococcus opacus]